MKIRFIVNPVAGIHKKTVSKISHTLMLKEEQKISDKIQNFFKDKNLKFQIEVTGEKNDASLFAKKARKGDIVVAVGGDGTINEILNAIKPGIKLAIIPTGSENVIAQEFNIPINFKKACRIIINQKVKKLDLGSINNHKFLFVAGIGLDAHAITLVKPFFKQLIGKHSYALAAIKSILTYDHPKIIIKTKNKTFNGYFLLISNVPHYGAKLEFTPDAKPDDGYLHLCLFKKKDVFNTFKALVSAKAGIIKLLPDIELIKIKEANITSEEKVLFHTDAEIKGTTPVKIKVLKKELELIVPKKKKKIISHTIMLKNKIIKTISKKLPRSKS